MTLFKLLSVSAAAMMALSLSACSANSAEMTAAKSSDANSYLKPGAAIRYSHNLKSQLTAGEVATFDLVLTEDYRGGTLQVSLSTEAGLSIVSSVTQQRFDMTDSGEHNMTLSVQGQSNGRNYINVEALAISPTGESQPRMFSIPVQVGPKTAQKPNPNMKTMDDGENIIEMTAQEEIK